VISDTASPAVRVAEQGAAVIRFDAPEVRGTNYMRTLILYLDQDTETAREAN